MITTRAADDTRTAASVTSLDPFHLARGRDVLLRVAADRNVRFDERRHAGRALRALPLTRVHHVLLALLQLLRRHGSAQYLAQNRWLVHYLHFSSVRAEVLPFGFRSIRPKHRTRRTQESTRGTPRLPGRSRISCGPDERSMVDRPRRKARICRCTRRAASRSVSFRRPL